MVDKIIEFENGEEKVFYKVPEEKYLQITDDNIFLDALRAAGVDNWSGYEVAQDIAEEWQDE